MATRMRGVSGEKGEVVIGLQDCDSLINALFDTWFHFTIINACGLDNYSYLLLFGDHPRPSTNDTEDRRNGVNSFIHIGHVLASNFIPNMAYSAVNVCHKIAQAVNYGGTAICYSAVGSG
eukprot:6214750-Pleurochrysis_carterae.AAC.5